MATKKKKGTKRPKRKPVDDLGPLKEFDKNVEPWIDALLNAKRAKSQAERTIAEHETLLMRELGNARHGRAPNGIMVIAKKMERQSYTAPACTFIQLKIVRPQADE